MQFSKKYSELVQMKTINNYINEKLKIGKNAKSQYNYFPKDRTELRKILEERLKEDKNANLNDIDVSEITDMGLDNNNESLFEDLDPHNIDVSQWDVSNVEDMSALFWGCENFNCDLSEWDVRKVKNMFALFKWCNNFKGTGLENWDVSSVELMNDMFSQCINFNCDISKWDVSNVKTMSYMFYNCKKFDCDLDNWKVSNTVTTLFTFNCCSSLKNIPKWFND